MPLICNAQFYLGRFFLDIYVYKCSGMSLKSHLQKVFFPVEAPSEKLRLPWDSFIHWRFKIGCVQLFIRFLVQMRTTRQPMDYGWQRHSPFIDVVLELIAVAFTIFPQHASEAPEDILDLGLFTQMTTSMPSNRMTFLPIPYSLTKLTRSDCSPFSIEI